MQRLTYNQELVLKLDVALGRPYRDCHTPREIAGRQRTLYSLEDKGLIEFRTEHWGANWRLTDAGGELIGIGTLREAGVKP